LIRLFFEKPIPTSHEGQLHVDVAYLKTLFAYDDWANRESLASLRPLTSPPSRALEVMGHIVGAQWLWLGRLNNQQEAAAVWPQLTIEQCANQIEELAAAWAPYLSALTPLALREPIAYTNSKGETWTSSVQDILTHIIIHSGYHRGQIATLLGRAGHTPAYTDFIHCIRQQKITAVA
jgi:uncharacterized damage-inducible protein DinB